MALVSENKILLVQRAHAPRQGLWAIPGGKVEYGETLIGAAHREVLEETGIDCEIGEVIWVGESIGDGDPPDHHYTLTDFLASVAGTPQPHAADDAADARWVTIEEARQMPMTPTMPSLLDVLTEYVG